LKSGLPGGMKDPIIDLHVHNTERPSVARRFTGLRARVDPVL